MKILVLNCGSSSIKFQLVDTQAERAISRGLVEQLQAHADFEPALAEVVESFREQNIDAIGHRVVHGGDQYSDAVIIDPAVIEAIKTWTPMAPLHNPRNLQGITLSQKLLPELPQVAVFDTSFHADLPRRASTYAIDTEVAHKHRIKRYGFHGTSHQYVSIEAANYLRRPLAELKIISLHLGSGASACAVEYGRSTETSMGMTPLEGLVMGQRSGDIDPGVLITLLRDEFDSVAELDNFLNQNSGLQGLSGIGSDLREIEAAAAQGHDRARLAIAVFAHQAKKYIGAYSATLGGVDAVVLTGGIGENSASLRGRILQRLDYLGLSIDADRNQDVAVDYDNAIAPIHSDTSRVKVLVVKANEELMIARQAACLIREARKPVRPGSIPISVSARHVHLSRETFALLFGEGAQPTIFKELSQPRQYACEEKVNLIGPRGRIEGVRLLGPLRSKNQVEVSRTDEFLLGVDAPVRDSGKVKGSAPITLEGPAGSVHLEEGLICARRHIHMTPEDAEAFSVKNYDEVEVAIVGGPRELIFGGVAVRVSPGFRLEMHIDTDEANAAELGSHTNGELAYTDIDSAAAEVRSRKTRTP